MWSWCVEIVPSDYAEPAKHRHESSKVQCDRHVHVRGHVTLRLAAKNETPPVRLETDGRGTNIVVMLTDR